MCAVYGQSALPVACETPSGTDGTSFSPGFRLQQSAQFLKRASRYCPTLRDSSSVGERRPMFQCCCCCRRGRFSVVPAM